MRRCFGLVVVLSMIVSMAQVGMAKTTVEFWYANEGWVYGDSLTALAKSFESANPDIAVHVSPMTGGSQYEQLLMANVVGGTPPDIAFFNRTRVIERGVQGIFEPLNKYIDPAINARLNKALMQEVTFKGSIWAAPLSFDLRGLFWNNRLLDEAGLDSRKGPVTLEELYTYTARLTKTTADGTITQLGFFPRDNNWQFAGWMFTFGGKLFNWEAGKPDVAVPQNVEALKWAKTYTEIIPYDRYLAFYNKHDSSLAQAFMDEKYAMMPGPSANIAQWRKNVPNLDFSVGRVPHPSAGANGTWSGGASIVIPKGAKNAQAAAKFLNYLLQEDSQQAYFNASYNFPVNTQAMAHIQTKDKAVLAFADQAGELNPRPPLWGDFTDTLNAIRDRVLNSEVGPSIDLFTEAQRILDARAREVGLYK